jgi:hypothetical protein
MEFVVKKTTELTDGQIGQISALFAEVFEGNRKDAATFREQYMNTEWGYSLHGLMIEGGRIVGTNSCIPVNYIVDGQRVTWMVGGDTMVKQEYRNFVDTLDMLELCYEVVRKDHGVGFFFGFPNDNAHQFNIKGLGFKDIARLHTFVLPYRVGGVKLGLRWLNPLSMLACRVLVAASRLQCPDKPVACRIDKDRTNFAETRLRWFGGDYRNGEAAGCRFVYRIKRHEGVRTAFIIDMDRPSPRAVNGAVRHILRRHSRDIDLVMYVGRLPFRPLALPRLPRRFEPKNFWFVGKVLDKKAVDNDIVLDPDNWNVNLSCYDLL